MLIRLFYKPLISKIHNARNIVSTCSDTGINTYGIHSPKKVFHNLSYSELFDHEKQNKEGEVLQCKYGETFLVDTGKFTGRSPQDKWIVKNIASESDKNIWWGETNRPIPSSVFNGLNKTAINHFNTLDKCYVFDGYCGASLESRKNVRFIHELAWQQHFVSNMFIKPETDEELTNFTPDFTIINACSETNKNWEKDGLNSEVAIAFNIEEKLAIILGTWYGGENKKGIFSLMNYWLTLENILSMHCSANVGKNGDTALFFGLSGTGKTTLLVDSERCLIGDDEHGWDDSGIFNLEGGCYAKTIDLTEETEPEIYKAIKTNALLENVSYTSNLIPDYGNTEKTQNGRVSYPIDHISNWHKPQTSGHPDNIIFLTCDAFGVLPPVSKLSIEQSMYHFLNGYTCKIAGTERGITEPQAVFSACFGEPFLTLHPFRYAELLKEKLEKHNSNVYLVNTGWSGGPYGVGSRMSIADTRKCINAIFTGEIEEAHFQEDAIFGFEVPLELPGLDTDVCVPINSWDNIEEYYNYKNKLASMFIDNYKKYTGDGVPDYSDFGPKI